MEIDIVKVGYLEENCYILTKNNKVLIIDPGDEEKKIEKHIKGDVVGILLTHHHFDHIGALDYFKNKYNVLVNAKENKYFNYEIIYNPGHSWDSKSFYFKEDKIMFVGDFIFKDSIGRTDLGGSNKDMLKSLKMISTYPDDIILYPGHGDKTTLGHEKNNFKYYNL